MDNKVAVAFATDHNFYYYTGVALFTLMEHASEKTQYDIVILSESLPGSDCEIFYRLVEGRENFSLRILDLAETMREINKDKLQLGPYPPSVLYRLFLHEILPEYDKILYLDSDIIVRSDVKELFDTDLEDFAIGAVIDRSATKFPLTVTKLKYYLYFRNTLKLKKSSKYFNSGVLLMDLNKLRHSDFSDQWRREINSELTFFMPDQDILNRIFGQKILYLDKTWNFMTKTGDRIDKEKIVHISGIHPWLSIRKPHADLWWHAAEKTFFAEDMKKYLILHPRRIKYLEEMEKSSYEMMESTCWRMTAVVRLVSDTIKWIKILFKEIFREK